MFKDLSFTEVFESLDDESLALIAQNDPEQLQRMCMFLSLDQQMEKENYYQDYLLILKGNLYTQMGKKLLNLLLIVG